MLSLSIRTVNTAKHSKAQRDHTCTKQQTKYVPIRVRIKRSMYMDATSGLFSWSMELLAFASRLFAPKVLDHLLHLSVIPIHSCERA